MNDIIVCNMYLDGDSMRGIATKLNTNHKMISRVLSRNGVVVREPMNLRGKKKFNCSKERLYNNMATHLRFNVTTTWLMQFDDIEKLKMLNRAITNRSGRWCVTTEWYTEYVEKFFNDPQFNTVYEAWCVNTKDRYMMPSIDHIVPTSKGGSNEINNLQFLTWFENRCKNNMTQTEWGSLKLNIGDYLI